MQISYKYLFQTPKPGCTTSPLRTSASFLPLERGSFPRISTQLRRMPSGIIRLRPPANTMQMSCAEHDPGCPEASTPARCLVCQQENDCREKRLLAHTRHFAAQLCTRGVVGQEAEETRRWEEEQGGREGEQGKRKRAEASLDKTISHSRTLKLEASESIWAKRV